MTELTNFTSGGQHRSDHYLKIAVSIAILIISLSVSYYYAIFLPKKADREMIIAQEREQQRIDDLRRQAEDADKAKTGRAASYRTCVAVAQSVYGERFSGACKRQHEADFKLHETCINNGIDEAYCNSTYEIRPAANCAIMKSLADSYENELRNAKSDCRDEAEANLSSF